MLEHLFKHTHFGFVHFIFEVCGVFLVVLLSPLSSRFATWAPWNTSCEMQEIYPTYVPTFKIIFINSVNVSL